MLRRRSRARARIWLFRENGWRRALIFALFERGRKMRTEGHDGEERSMKIEELPEFENKPKPFALQGEEMVSTAVRTMADRNIGSVVIVDRHQKVRGIVTERDLLRRLLGGKLDPETTPLSAIMTSELYLARIDDEHYDWLRMMSNKRFRHLPIVDEEGRLVNLMSQGDFVSHSWPELVAMVSDKASETIKGPAGQLPILLGGLMLYTIVIVTLLKFL
jgi:CBS domain-containing protein